MRHTGTCQHVNLPRERLQSATPEMHRGVPACRDCAEPMNGKNGMQVKSLSALGVLVNGGKLVSDWPTFRVEGVR